MTYSAYDMITGLRRYRYSGSRERVQEANTGVDAVICKRSAALDGDVKHLHLPHAGWLTDCAEVCVT